MEESSYAYHPDFGAKLVHTTEEYEYLLLSGWYDTPAKFPDKNAVIEVKKNDRPTRNHRKSVPTSEISGGTTAGGPVQD